MARVVSWSPAVHYIREILLWTINWIEQPMMRDSSKCGNEMDAPIVASSF
ncbi:MAG: hypothetical protein L7W43_18410 [Rubripirellula sp.]|nr:hypothetical protein [Rubripirellula sp.]